METTCSLPSLLKFFLGGKANENFIAIQPLKKSVKYNLNVIYPKIHLLWIFAYDLKWILLLKIFLLKIKHLNSGLFYKTLHVLSMHATMVHIRHCNSGTLLHFWMWGRESDIPKHLRVASHLNFFFSKRQIFL